MLARLTAEELPNYPEDEFLAFASAPDHPVTGISGWTAQAYCRYCGKRLPLVVEWTKAVRGGLELPDGSSNPAPRRLYPWTGTTAPAGVNFEGAADGCLNSCSVGARAPEHDVYGVRDLAGNVVEWALGWERPRDGKVWPILGGGYATLASADIATTAVTNMREPRIIDFQTGARCVIAEGDE